MIVIKLYEGFNIKELELLGFGTQGKVYKINSDRCIKIFKRKQICADELETLVMAQKDSHFPKLYSHGENYIIREYIDGIELDKYLSSHPLTASLSTKLIHLYEAMIQVGYNRLDTALFHIFITPSDDMKLIDTAKSMKKKTLYPYLIIKGLEELGYKRDFFNFIKDIRPDLYTKWLNSSSKEKK
ncbi:hypothetical protein [Clostridium vincentii]|uniref:Protein kinase domain-containing protein n=1 Tax=Clostridium vincentii TaxID=52704 RepID=A0A2T0BIV1_9CLOT|nr:hypothetical protein [Clostridium vincentii]PRR83804.1 hypothetical protein CLVI_07510 [Clostridium vincentii]